MSPEMWAAVAGGLVGFFVGGFLGVLIMSLLACGGRDDQARGL